VLEETWVGILLDIDVNNTAFINVLGVFVFNPSYHLHCGALDLSSFLCHCPRSREPRQHPAAKLGPPCQLFLHLLEKSETKEVFSHSLPWRKAEYKHTVTESVDGGYWFYNSEKEPINQN
jgi:hypothetical protein